MQHKIQRVFDDGKACEFLLCELPLGVLWVVLEITWVRHETRDDHRTWLFKPEQNGWNVW